MSTNNAAFGYLNHIVNGTVTDTSHATGFPGSNLQGSIAYPPWQTAAATTTAGIDIDRGAMASWGAVGMFRTNFTSSATIRVKLGTAATLGDIYDSGNVAASVVAGYGQTVFLLPAGTAAARYCRITIADSTNPDGFLQAGLAFAGPLWIPSRNFAYGEAAGWKDPSVITTAKGGQKYIDQRPQFRANSFKFENLGKGELWSNAMEIDRLMGVQNNLLYIPEPNGANMMQEAIFGSLTQLDDPARTNFQRYSKAYSIEERL